MSRCVTAACHPLACWGPPDESKGVLPVQFPDVNEGVLPVLIPLLVSVFKSCLSSPSLGRRMRTRSKMVESKSS